MEADKIEFRVDGLPKGQPRVKAYVRGQHAGIYTPATADSWKDCVRAAARAVRRPEPMTGPVSFLLVALFPRPQGHYGTGRNAGVVKPGISKWHVAAPDFDNLAKAVSDVLTEVGLWVDDRQVAEHLFRKRYIDAGDRPGAIIRIEHLPEPAAGLSAKEIQHGLFQELGV